MKKKEQKQQPNSAMIPMKDIVESPYNPRRRYDKKRMEELVVSIKHQGVLEPILLRKVGSKLEIMAGSRRFRAAKTAGLPEIPGIIREATDANAIEICVTENLQRDDTHELEEANGYRELLEIPGYTVSAVAAKVGKDESYVYKRLKLLDLKEEIQDSFLKGEMTAEHAVLIARLQPEEQTKAFAALFQNDFGYRDPGEKRARTAQSLRRWINDTIMLKVSSAKFKTTEENLLTDTPSCVNCPKRTGFNKALFNDIKETDLCTDPACFALKTQAHIELVLDDAEAKGKPILRVSANYEIKSRKPDDPLPASMYQEVEKEEKCSSMEKAIVAHGSRDIGKQIQICQNPKCPIHGRLIMGHSADSEKWKRQQERQELQKRIKKATRQAILQEALDKVGDPMITKMSRVLWELTVIGSWANLWNESQKAISARLKWEKINRSSYGVDWDAMCRKAIGPMTDNELCRLMLEIATTKQLEWYPDSGKDRILELAELMEVDQPAITERVKNEMNEAAKKRRKKAKKLAKAKAKNTSKTEPTETEPDEEEYQDEDHDSATGE
jgi:ParB family chromosome partitioning protein